MAVLGVTGRRKLSLDSVINLMLVEGVTSQQEMDMNLVLKLSTGLKGKKSCFYNEKKGKDV